VLLSAVDAYMRSRSRREVAGIVNSPKTLSPDVLTFCDRLVPGVKPVYLPVTGAPSYKENECFINIEKQVLRFKGERLVGWTIWEWPGHLLDAELHAVWREPKTKKLHDLTPRPKRPDITRILFLEESGRAYTGQQVDNVRSPLSNHPTVTEYIAAGEAYFEFCNRGDRANEHGELKVRGADADEYEAIRDRLGRAQIAMTQLP
jgi:hypothetical protein